MVTKQQRKNRVLIEKQKRKIIRYLNENEMIVFFLLGVSILFMVGCLAVAVAWHRTADMVGGLSDYPTSVSPTPLFMYNFGFFGKVKKTQTDAS